MANILASILQTTSSAATERIEGGSGTVGARSIRFDTIRGGIYSIAIANIGTLQIETGDDESPQMRKTAWGLVIVGVPLILAFGLGLILIAIGLWMLYKASKYKPDQHLAIGTCDSQRFSLVSKDRQFLIRVMDFISAKIDDEADLRTARLDVSNANNAPNGAVAIGDHSRAVAHG